MTKHYIYQTADTVMYDKLKQYAKENKMFLTDAERALWAILKSKSLGYKFRQQHIIGDYIADFVSLHYHLIIELDGKYHFKGDQPINDQLRTNDLNRMGFQVLRVTNEEVLHAPFQVINKIKQAIMNIESRSRPSKKAGIAKLEGQINPENNAVSSVSPPFGEAGGGFLGDRLRFSEVERNAWAVDAACSGNPGPMEYQAIDLQTGARVFHFGPMHGTNNIGEFLAIVHALALLDKQGDRKKVIYSDSYNAILWVHNKKCKTKLARTPQTEALYQIVERAENWLRTHEIQTRIIKWETKKWGEVPADFGRK